MAFPSAVRVIRYYPKGRRSPWAAVAVRKAVTPMTSPKSAGDCGADVYRMYATTARGVDRVLWDYNILDLTPYGRQEPCEDSPAGWPQAHNRPQTMGTA